MLAAPTPGPDGADPAHHATLEDAARYGVPAAERAAARTGAGRFSQAALAEFKARVDDYAADLAREAQRVAERHQADVVSPSYVRQASGYLVTRTRDRKLAALGSLGAMLLGVGLPPLLEVPWAHEISAPRVLLSAVFGMLGSFLMTLRHRRE
jgi:histone H3/H4